MMWRAMGVMVLLAAIGTVALAKDVTVAADGSGDFKTVKGALDAVPAGNKEPVRITIKPGKYEELIATAKDKAFITLIGAGAKPEETVLTYHYKALDTNPAGTGTVGTTGSASWTINGNDFTAENLTFANSAGDNVGQAVALKTNGDRLIFRNCRFLGFQDTLYPAGGAAGGGRCYFKDCYITGDTDFIFGNAVAVFDHCTINSSDAGYVTAANTAAATAIGYVFLDCTLTAPASVKAGSVYLGRPWQWDRGSKASVTYIRTKMGPQIAGAGWHPWDVAGNTKPGETTRYSEFGSMDLEGKPLDVSKRVEWAHVLKEEELGKYAVEKVLAGSDGWKPGAGASAK